MNAVMDAAVRHPRKSAAAGLLEDIEHVRLILLCAPAGFGKTSALQALAQRRRLQGDAVAWLSLGEADSDLPRFVERLLAALHGVGVESGAMARRRLLDCQNLPLASLVDLLLAELDNARRDVLLVLDDLQQLRSGEVPLLLERILRLAPSGLRIAIGSSQAPLLPLGRLRVEGHLLEIGVEQLRLDAEDSRELLDRLGVELDDASFETLFTRTEGWPMGLQLAARWLKQGEQATSLAETGGIEHVGHYLMQRVFESLPDELQEQLLALSIVAQFNAGLASTLSGVRDGQALLERLETQQLFLQACDPTREWYRFHPLFGEFLRNRLEIREPVRFRQLHFNASLWYANHHLQLPAIEHAALADDPQMLAALVDGCALELVNQGQLLRIHAWRQLIPDAVAEQYPMLVLADAWLQAAGRSRDQAYDILDELEERYARPGPGENTQASRLAIHAVKSMIALQKDDLQTCVALAAAPQARPGRYPAFLEVALLLGAALAQGMLAQPRQSLALIAQARQRTHLLRGDYLSMQLANLELLMELEQGRPAQARTRLEAMRDALMGQFEATSSALALPGISAALVDYQQGRLDGLQERLRLSLRRLDLISPIDLQARTLLALARLQRFNEQGREARSSLALLKGLAQRNGCGRLLALAQAEEVAMLLQDTDAEACRRAEQALRGVDWESLATPYAGLAFNPVIFCQGLSRVRLLLARGANGDALREIAALERSLMSDWHGLQRLRLRLLGARAQHALGYRERALKQLQGCLLDAEHEDLRCVFLEEGEGIRQLLRELENSEREPGLQTFVRQLLALWPQQAPPLCQSLTERERSILELAADGMTNEQIGKRLELALGTVKWHMHNIYDKLQVRNRTQAIRRLRENEGRA